MRFSRRVITSLLALSLLGAAGQSAAYDEWDEAVVKDNTAATTRNELQPGVWQYHDLQTILGSSNTPDQDWYILKVSPFRSYEVAVGQVTGDTPIGNADFLELYDASGSNLIASAPGGPGASDKYLRFSSDAASEFRVRVKGGTGSVLATAKTRYGISYRESTMYCPRFNNNASQVSVLMVQNASDGACTVDATFFDESGGSLATFSTTINASGLAVVATSTLPGLAGTKGSVQLNAASCPATALKAKISALEPVTGFSFDTECSRR